MKPRSNQWRKTMTHSSTGRWDTPTYIHKARRLTVIVYAFSLIVLRGDKFATGGRPTDADMEFVRLAFGVPNARAEREENGPTRALFHGGAK